MEIDGLFVVLIILLMGIMWAIFDLYKRQVDGWTFLRGVYLYIALSVIFVAIIGKYLSGLSITEHENMGKMIVLYFLGAFIGLCMIYSDAMVVNHLGLALLCISIGLVMGVTFRNSTNIVNALVMTSIIIIIFTSIAFFSSEKGLMMFKSWLPYLVGLLVMIIVVDLLGTFAFGGRENFGIFMSYFTVLVFMGFLLADTSKLLIDMKKLGCVKHSCINYPRSAVGLLLDYANIFVNMNRLR
jgi:FtsH-binding integral membrane protein